jgi:hypothetical protein
MDAYVEKLVQIKAKDDAAETAQAKSKTLKA